MKHQRRRAHTQAGSERGRQQLAAIGMQDTHRPVVAVLDSEAHDLSDGRHCSQQTARAQRVSCKQTKIIEMSGLQGRGAQQGQERAEQQHEDWGIGGTRAHLKPPAAAQDQTDSIGANSRDETNGAPLVRHHPFGKS